MRSEVNLFGKRISIASRTRRRWLVGVFYGFFAVLLAASWKVHPGGADAGFWTIEFGVLMGPPFLEASSTANTISSDLQESSSHLKAMKSSRGQVGRDWRASFIRRSVIRGKFATTSERFADAITRITLRSGIVGIVTTVAFVLRYAIPFLYMKVYVTLGLSTQSVHLIVYLLLQIGWVFSMTLPQAILIWTEPDMGRRRNES